MSRARARAHAHPHDRLIADNRRISRGRPQFDETGIAAPPEPMPSFLIGCLCPTNALFVPWPALC